MNTNLIPIGSCDAEHARRDWVRFITPNLITRLSWNGHAPVSHLVTLVSVNETTATLLMDVEPPAGQVFALTMENRNVRMGAIPSKLIEKELTGSGRTLARFGFESAIPRAELDQFVRDRRAWKRVVPHEKRTVLKWRGDPDETVVRGELRDISGGGAAVRITVLPPPTSRSGSPREPRIWRRARSNVGLVGHRHDSEGNIIAHLLFVDLCPLRIYEVAMGLLR